uniref:NADH dehydrogenase subunit 1 n=1 Tax=Beauveria brongniartii TaxID=118266 RepID=B5KQ09_9HYPO|nr:NADH dehydrogenase subunit 1 [Beauveria brongniartii]ABU50179.1 NADH dehydrogenase subunit 1 [Beauveria brongniartii]
MRFYHSDKSIEILYKNRKAPLKPFKGNIVSVCEDLLSLSFVNTYFKNYKRKRGIYMFTLKNNSDIFYIGRAKDLGRNLIFKSHLNVNLNDRFHTFAKTIGLDKWIKGGIKGNYLFSHELVASIACVIFMRREPLLFFFINARAPICAEKYKAINSRKNIILKEISLLRKFNNCKVWIYDALTLELLTDKFPSMQKAADYFNIDYRTILNNMDTNLAIMKGNKWILIFSHELTESKKKLLISNTPKAVNRNCLFKGYVKKLIGGYILLDNINLFNTSKFGRHLIKLKIEYQNKSGVPYLGHQYRIIKNYIFSLISLKKFREMLDILLGLSESEPFAIHRQIAETP